jgi:hypothetical protein
MVQCRLCEFIQNPETFSAVRRIFFVCEKCGYVQVLGDFLPTASAEHHRYEQHNNSLNDPRYIEHLQLVNHALLPFLIIDKIGLDFGCGPTKAMEYLWEKLGKKVLSYDPYFYPDESLLKSSYGFVICCEVVEHFHHPRKEFDLLNLLLEKDSVLAIQTSFYSESREFEKWNYQRDFTHVGFFSPKSFSWIAERYNWEILFLEDPVAIFRKK